MKNIEIKDDNLSASSFIFKVIEEADQAGASDIHIEREGNGGKIRFRIDGILQDIYDFPIEDHDYIVNSLLIVCNLDSGRIVVPEEGHFSHETMDNNNVTRSFDVRSSFFPTARGVNVVLRILNKSEMLLSVSDLGMSEENINKLKRMAMRSYGMFLTTGPVGSGKTTTLYSILNNVGTNNDRKIITLEDPVEFGFDNMQQCQIRPEVGFTFAVGMKSILRQDPDVVMIGEIRDAETAEYAIKASLAGRAVFSSIHANSTVGVIARLSDMGIDRGLIAYAINGVMAQRLVRKICPACKIDDSPRPEFIKITQANPEIKFKKGRGCPECRNTGYKGRIGIFEILEFDDDFRALIVEKAPSSALLEQALGAGLVTLKKDVMDKVAMGITTLEEAIKAAF
ncbi:MAG: GspE/PulE family protein [Candidatus Moranbacteria bacterium]|nr:GspE/PulE family protein [Candidatus Moranbacteria bacterium]